MRTLFEKIFSSIGFKLALVVAAMGAMTAAAILTGLVVFNSLAGSLNSLLERQLPGIESSVSVILQTGQIRDAMSELYLSKSPEALAENANAFSAKAQQLADIVARLPDDTAARIRPHVADLQVGGAAMAAALGDSFESNAQMQAQLDQFEALSEHARSQLLELSDAAYFNLTLGSEETIASVSKTLSALVNDDFVTLTSVLRAQAEINLLAGIAMEKLEFVPPGLATILADLSASSLRNLDTALKAMASNDSMAVYMPDLVKARDALAELVTSDTAARQAGIEHVLTMRKLGATVIGAAIDDLTFSLAVNADDASESNKEAIQSLIEVQVHQIRETAKVDLALKSLIATGLRAASANSVSQASAAQIELEAQAAHLSDLAKEAMLSQDVLATVSKFGAMADPEQGVAAARTHMLVSRDAIGSASRDALQKLERIADAARALGTTATTDAARAADKILAQTSAAETRLNQVALVSLVLALSTPLLAWFFILRPLAGLTRLTERLAKGDLSPISGPRRNRGEIGRMASALSVFRQGLIEREEMRKLEAEAQAERAARASEQEHVVSRLEHSLATLSSGDLTAVINDAFSDGYDDLRHNYNQALSHLSDLIRQLTDSAAQVQNSAVEINGAASDLAVHTEENARTLADTSVALTELASTAAQTADQTEQARTTMAKAHEKTLSGASVAESAVESMTEIEMSSAEISKIVGLIEDIAFQTNLLALNASVEAARSGEHGRGFSVVATEVRSLAQRATDAASDINELINAARTQISAGVTQVKETGSALADIHEMVGQLNSFITGITEASQEQSTSVSTINNAISRLDRSTQKNAAVFEETAAATKLLSDEATRLSALSGEFKVAPGEPSAGLADDPREAGTTAAEPGDGQLAAANRDPGWSEEFAGQPATADADDTAA